MRGLALRLLAALAFVPVAYLLAALIGAAIPVNAGWREPPRGVTIYVADNGIHTGIIVPAVHPLHDWRPLVKPSHLPDPRQAGDWLEFGWGDRDFYLNTPTWAEFSLTTALKAAVGAGEGALVHVDHWREPIPGPDVRRLTVSEGQYSVLVERLRASFRLDEAGRAAPVRGYGPSDVFYPAHGRYSAFQTCNSWVGRTLAHAGVRMGAWTPFSAMVMAWMPKPSQSARAPS